MSVLIQIIVVYYTMVFCISCISCYQNRIACFKNFDDNFEFFIISLNHFLKNVKEKITMKQDENLEENHDLYYEFVKLKNKIKISQEINVNISLPMARR